MRYVCCVCYVCNVCYECICVDYGTCIMYVFMYDMCVCYVCMRVMCVRYVMYLCVLRTRVCMCIMLYAHVRNACNVCRLHVCMYVIDVL